MKRLFITGLMLLGLGAGTTYAQSGEYQDDIYFNSSDAKNLASQKPDHQSNNQAQDNREVYTSSGRFQDGSDDNYSYDRSYETDDYIDFDDDYYYATRLRRFSSPFYNLNYFSAFYNPFWYDRNWVDPYWGWSTWSRPSLSISIGWGAPYWSSYWGWHNWYGYPGFYSPYGSPYWGGGYYGGYYGGGGFYNGYWDGYYAGLYNNYNGGRTRNVVYGPRVGFNSTRNSAVRSTGFNRNNVSTLRVSPNGGATGNGTVRPNPGGRFQTGPEGRNATEADGRVYNSRDNRIQPMERTDRAQPQQPAAERGRFFSNDGTRPAVTAQEGRTPMADRQQYNNQQQRSVQDRPMSQPSYERPQPRFEQQRSYSPEPRSGGFGGDRGGSNFGGSRPSGGFGGGAPAGGGGFGGGRRR